MLWLLTTAALGVLDTWSLPPPIVPLFGFGFVLVGLTVFGLIGHGLATLPQAFLVGAQGFRVLVELLIHRAVSEGVPPPQLTWLG